MSAKINIYLSSTFSDLEEYRDAIKQTLSMDSFNNSVNLHFGDSLVNSDVTVWDAVEKQISRCEYYFLLLANKYGSVCADKKINPDAISYTEHEYETAVRTKKKIILFYSDDPALKDCIDFNQDGSPDLEKKKKLSKFVEKARSLNTVISKDGRFKNLDKLVNQVMHATVALMYQHFPDMDLELPIHLFCDRIHQVAEFQDHQPDPGPGFHTYLVRGDDQDLGSNLIRRFIFKELHKDISNYIEVDFELLAPTFELCARRLLNLCLSNMPGKQRPGDSIAEVLKKMDTAAPERFVIFTFNVAEIILKEQEMAFFPYFISACKAIVDESFTSTFVFFINLTESAPSKNLFKSLFGRFIEKEFVPVSSPLINRFLVNTDGLYDTTRLRPLSEKEIKIWMRKEFNLEEDDAESLFETYFYEFKKGQYKMKQLAKPLKDFTRNVFKQKQG